MAITNAQQARQLQQDGGPMKKIKGQDHMLAYITPKEADKLVKLGGQETMTPEGILAYPERDNYGFSSDADFNAGDLSKSNDPNVRGEGVGFKGQRQNRVTQQQLAARNAAEKEKERIRQEKIQKQINLFNKKKVEKLKNFKKKELAEIIAEDELENIDITDKGIFGNLNDIRTNLAKKTLVNSIATKLGAMPKSYVPSLFMSDMVRTTPKGINTDTLTDMLSPDFDMGLYGISGKDLTKAQNQLDVAKQNTISQDDFDSVYGNKPPVDRGGDGGNQYPYIPIVNPIQTAAAEPVVEEEDETINYRLMADGGMTNDAPVYEGGIMDLESSRQMYGLGKLVKKVTRSVKKIAKSPIGKAALLYAGGSYLSGMGAFGGLKGAGVFNSQALGLKNFLMGKPLGFKDLGKVARKPGFLDKIGGKYGAGILGTTALSYLMTPKEEMKKNYMQEQT